HGHQDPKGTLPSGWPKQCWLAIHRRRLCTAVPLQPSSSRHSLPQVPSNRSGQCVRLPHDCLLREVSWYYYPSASLQKEGVGQNDAANFIIRMWIGAHFPVELNSFPHHF